MSIAITDDHRALADTAADFLTKRDARGAARALLESPDERLPAFWDELVALGWLGLHVPEGQGGSGLRARGAGRRGRAVGPGGRARAVRAHRHRQRRAGRRRRRRGGDPPARSGRRFARRRRGPRRVRHRQRRAGLGPAGNVLGGGLAGLLLVATGDDVAVVEVGDGVTVETPANLDPTRRTARVALDGAPAVVLPGARRVLVDLARLILSAEAVGLARECTEMAAGYAKERIQFGRPIAMFQASSTTAPTWSWPPSWPPVRCGTPPGPPPTGGDQLTYAAAWSPPPLPPRPPTGAPT